MADSQEKLGSGLLGFSPKRLSPGDEAYLNALGLSAEQISQVLHDLRDGMSPLTRASRQGTSQAAQGQTAA
jgi:hypothetical protein